MVITSDINNAKRIKFMNLIPIKLLTRDGHLQGLVSIPNIKKVYIDA